MMNLKKTFLLLLGLIPLSIPLSANYYYTPGYDYSYGNRYYDYPIIYPQQQQNCCGVNPSDFKHVPYYNPKNPGQPLPEEENKQEETSEEEAEPKEEEESTNNEEEEKEKCPPVEHVFFADFLWWKGHKCLLDFAAPFDPATGRMIGKVHHVTPRWNAGFRVAAYRQKEGIQFGLKYTHFNDRATRTVSDESGHLAATRIDAQFQATQDGHIQWARSTYKQEYNVIDLEGGYSPEIENYTVRIFAGARLAYIDRKLSTRYAALLTDKDGSEGNPVDIVKQRADMDAYGLYFGLGGGGKLCGCLGLFGETSFGAHLGFFETTYKQKELPFVHPNTYTKNICLRNGCYSLVCNFDLAAGVSLEFCGPCQQKYWLKVGYEFHYWWNTPDFFQAQGHTTPNFHTITRNNCGLGFDGLFVRLEGKF